MLSEQHLLQRLLIIQLLIITFHFLKLKAVTYVKPKHTVPNIQLKRLNLCLLKKTIKNRHGNNVTCVLSL